MHKYRDIREIVSIYPVPCAEQFMKVKQLYQNYLHILKTELRIIYYLLSIRYIIYFVVLISSVFEDDHLIKVIPVHTWYPPVDRAN